MSAPRSKYTREDPETRRLDLIQAAARSLAEHGVAGTSVREVAARAGVSFGLIRFYFGSMDRLISETYRYIGDKVTRALDEAVAAAGDDPAARLDGFIDANFREPILDPELLATWLAFWSRVGSDPEVARLHREIYAGTRERLALLLAAVAGKATDAPSIRLSAIAITATIDGLWLELCLDPSAFSAAEAVAITRRVTAVALGDAGFGGAPLVPGGS